jgi:hypothetical protein
LVGVGCASQDGTTVETLVEAERVFTRVGANDTHLVLTDGAEASTDPSREGVVIRVFDLDGRSLRSIPADTVVRELAVGREAVATIEIRSTLGDQRVRLIPLDGGDPVEPELEETPLEISATSEGFLWIEAELRGALDRDGDGLFERAELSVLLVESDERGRISSRTEVDALPAITAPFGLLSPLPRAFGLARLWGGRALVTEPIVDDTCECADIEDNVFDQGTDLILDGEGPLIVGSTFVCAGTVAHAGFAVVDGERQELVQPINHAVTDGFHTILGGDDFPLLRRDRDAFVPMELQSHGRITGLALVAEELYVATEPAVLVTGPDLHR